MFVESVLSDLHRDLWAQKRASKPKCISNVLCKLFVARNAHKSTWTAFVDASLSRIQPNTGRRIT